MKTADPAREERILSAAGQLFAERHYHEVRIDDIAVQAGVSKGSVYNHFKDKEDLYLALTLQGMKALYERVRGIAAVPAEPEDRLLGLVREVTGFFQAHPHYLELITRIDLSRSAAHAAALKTSREQFFELLVEIIEEMNASGRWSASNPRLAAHALMGMIREILRWQAETVPDLPEQVTGLFLHGVGVR